MSLWLKLCIILLFIACIDSMQWREPTSWTFMGVLDGHDYSRGSQAFFWKPNCPHGFLRVGDAVTSENIIPTGVIACVFGQDYEITPISHDMMTLIYDPANSDLLFYRGFAPGPVAMLGTMITTTASFTPDVGKGKRSTEDIQALDPNLQFYAAFIGPCLGTHQWCDLTSRFESAGQFIIGFNPFESLHFSMPGSLFLPSSNPNPSILGCLSKKCACGGCVHGNCSEDGRCDCHPQWMGLSCDKDINECAQGTAQCDPIVACINEMGGYTCGPCPPGFDDVHGNGTLCEDIDECADPTLNDCASLGLNCTNLPGRFQCTDCEVGSYRPTPGSQCRFQSCGNGKWDDKEECDGGLGCFANNCTCSPLWEPMTPRSPDCQRRCGNLRLDLPEEQCDGGEGCRPELCICNTGRGYQPINSTSCGFRLTDPEDILCARLSGNGCEECTQFNCIWCPNEEISCVPRSRPTGGCTTTCNGSAVIVPTPSDEATESLNKIILIISLVGASVIVVAGIGIGVLVIYRRRKRLKRMEEERLLDLERKRMAAVSKYGIARSEVGQTISGEWNPPEDSTLILVEQLPFMMSKPVFDFHNGENQFKVNSLYVDRVTISLKDKVPKPPKKSKKMDEDKVPLVAQTEHKKRSGEADEVHFVFHNVDSHKYRLEFTPSSGYLKKGKDLDITITMEVKMTTEVELVAGIELPDYHQHSFVMSPVTSELSSFIDLDEVQLDSRKPLGDGAFGIVYKGFYRGQDVAVKILKMQDMPEEMLDEFDREIDLMNKLRHKNIVQFIGASKVVGKLAIVTEFIEFGNCHHLLHQSSKPLDFDFKVKIALDAARAIRFLHQNNILHRDIKPDNLLIVSLDTHAPVAAKLTDFGTSRAVSKLSNQYTTGIGTPSYMAPEILGKKPYDTKADVYSFGILLWSLYTQKEPYIWIEHSWEVAQYVLEGKRELIPANCPSLYAQLIESCWAQDPEQRLTMEGVISALENIVKMSKFWTGM